MKEGWEIKTLGEACIVERGSSPRPIEKFITNDENGVNWIKIGDTKGVNKYLCSTEQKITPEGAKQSRFVKEGDFILSNSMSFGNPFIMRTRGYIHDGWFVLRLPKYIDANFFYYLLISPNVQKQIKSLASGAIVKNISGDLVKRVNISYPPLSEQQRIVSILDQTFAAIDKAKENAQRNLQNAKELFESYLLEVFEKKGEGWEEKKLEELCSEITVGFVGTMANKYKETGIPFLRSQNIKPHQIILKDVIYIDNEFNCLLKKSQLKPGDIAIVRTGYPGTAAVIPEDLPISNCSDIVIAKAGPKIIPHFLCYFMNSTYGKRLVLGNLNGAAQKHFNVGSAKKVKIPVPNLEVQNKLILELNTLSAETQKLEAIYQQKIINLEELKKTILQKAFNGEL